MTCQELMEQLLDFVAGDLEADFHAAIEEHLLRCSHCNAYVHSYRITITITRRLPSVQMPNQFARRLEHLLQELEEADD